MPERLFLDIGALRQALRSGTRHYVYVLHRTGAGPFYVGKGVDDRCLHHEAEARTTKRLSHKLNLIRAVHRSGQSIAYEIDSFHEDEASAHARERELIRLLGRHDFGRGPLTNQTDGGEGASNPSEASRERRRESLWGDNAEDPDRQVANRYFQKLTSVRSVPLKASSSFKAEGLWRNRTQFPMSARQAAALAASAIANRVMLEPGAVLPRRLNVDGVELVIENGVGRDMLSSDMVTLADEMLGRELLKLSPSGFRYMLDNLDVDLLIDAGVLDPR